MTTDISVPLAMLNEALEMLRNDHACTEDELRSECENAIDNVMDE